MRFAVARIVAVALFACTLAPAGAATFPNLQRLYNLDYSKGVITVFDVDRGAARIVSRFAPSKAGARGLAVDRRGRMYTAVNAPNGKPCTACIAIFAPDGSPVAQLAAPILPGAPGAPSLSDVSVDNNGIVYVSDYGQQAVYSFAPAGNGWAPATIVTQSNDAASVLAKPSGNVIFASGGCGFASARVFVRRGSVFNAGGCFGLGTIALYDGAVDDAGDVFTPVDGGPPLVAVNVPNMGGRVFALPGRLATVGGIALAAGGDVAYVADHHGEVVYAYVRPSGGWLSGTPAIAATYTGFTGLNSIAVEPR